MSFNRLHLRGLTISALTQQPGDEYAPTIANDAVFDSRLDEVEFDGDSVETPLIAVYTDRDQSRLLDKGTGRGARYRTVELRIELALASFSKVQVGEETQIQYGLPATDSELEALLDTFEAQVWFALRKPGRAVSDAWQQFVMEECSFDSMPMRSADGNNRLAARQITMELRIPTDCRPSAVIDTGQKPGAIDTDFQEAPWLSPMFKKITADPRYASVADVLRLNAGQPSVYLPALQRVGQIVNTTQLVQDVELFTQIGRPNGWMNRVIVQSAWTAPAPPKGPQLVEFDQSWTQLPHGRAPLYPFDTTDP